MSGCQVKHSNSSDWRDVRLDNVMRLPLQTSVIICTLGREMSVVECLDSIKKQLVLPSEVIIVDAAPGVHHQQWRKVVEDRFPLQIIETSAGLTHQRNVGLGYAKGDLIAFFDDDTVLEPGCLAAVIDVFASDQEQKIGAVCGNITGQQLVFRSPLSRLHAVGSRILCFIFFLSRPGNGNFLPSGLPTFVRPGQRPTRVECLYGAAMIFRANILKREKSDEHLTAYAYMEDDDLAYRVSRHHENIFVPAARLQHNSSPANRLRQRALGTMFIINHHYIFRKNFPQATSFRLAHLLSLIGYPLLQLWNLNPRRAGGAVLGWWSIVFRLDSLSKIQF